MAKAKNNVDVLEPPAPVKAVIIPDEVPQDEIDKVEKNIESDVVKYNVTKAVLSRLKEKHKNLKINGQADKDGYAAVHDARMEFVNTRVLITKVCKAGRETAVVIQKKWIAKEKELHGEIADDEARLEKMEKDYDAEKDRIKTERIEMQKNRLRDRMKALLAMGAVSDGIDVTLDDISFSQTDIREADEKDWLEDILSEYKKVFDAKEKIRIETEAKQKEEKDKQDHEREEFERQKRELEDQKRELENQKKEVADIKRNGRVHQLTALGMIPEFPSGDLVYKTHRVTYGRIDNETDNHWEMTVADSASSIQSIKDVDQREQQRQDEEKLEKLRIQAEEELAEKNRQDKIRQDEEALQATDKEKWAVFQDQVKELKIPVMKSPIYREIVETASYYIKKITALSAKKK